MKTPIMLIPVLFISAFLLTCCNSDNPASNNPVVTTDSTVILISPADDTVFYVPPEDSIFITYSWRKNPNAVYYNLQVSNDSMFWYNNNSNAYSSDTSLTFKLMTSSSQQTINLYWRVRIYNPVRPCPVWSEIFHFTVHSP